MKEGHDEKIIVFQIEVFTVQCTRRNSHKFKKISAMFSVKKLRDKARKISIYSSYFGYTTAFVYDIHFIWIFYTMYHLIFMQANPISYFFYTPPLKANLFPMKMIYRLVYSTAHLYNGNKSNV